LQASQILQSSGFMTRTRVTRYLPGSITSNSGSIPHETLCSLPVGLVRLAANVNSNLPCCWSGNAPNDQPLFGDAVDTIKADFRAEFPGEVNGVAWAWLP